MRYCSVQVHHCSIESIMCGCEQGGIYNINNFKSKKKETFMEENSFSLLTNVMKNKKETHLLYLSSPALGHPRHGLCHMVGPRV